VHAERFGTLPVGAALPSDAECAARVTPTPEIRPENAVYNNTRGSGPPVNPPREMYKRVTGNFTGTTDEILQWAACKWGIDVDVVRAQAVVESYWRQSTIGAIGDETGLMQLRTKYWGWFFPSARTSSAYNVDAALAARRSCFEGGESWVTTYPVGKPYAAGDLWGCIGLWFSGRWYDQAAMSYIAEVQRILNSRFWETNQFLRS
jgi:hypothetical protein